MKPPCNDILIGLHLNCAQGHICHSQWILIVINWSSTADQSLYFTHTAQHSNTISCARWWILSWISYHATKILVYIITFYIIIFLYFIGCFTVKKLQLFCFISFFSLNIWYQEKKSTLPVDLDIGMGVKLIWLQLSELKCVHQSWKMYVTFSCTNEFMRV